MHIPDVNPSAGESETRRRMQNCDSLAGLGARDGALRRISPLGAKILASGMAVTIFGLDYTLPGDVNSAIFYVCVVVVSAWIRSTRWLLGITALLALLAIAHTGIPFGTKPIGHAALNWIDLTNRYITASMLVVTAGFVYLGVRLRRELDTNEQVIAEVAARERAEEPLRERDSRIRRLVESNIIGTLFWDAEGRIVEANDSFLDIVGYLRADLLSKKLLWKDLTAPEFRAADLRALEELRETGTCTPFETEYIRQDGSRIPILLGIIRFEDPNGEGAAFVLGLTERNHARAMLRQAQADFAHAARVSMLGELTASIAHELGQPLAAIGTNCETGLRWLDRSQPNIEKACAAMKRTLADVRRCSDIIVSVRGMAAGKAPERMRVSIDEIIFSALTFLQHEIQSRSIAVLPRLMTGHLKCLLIESSSSK